MIVNDSIKCTMISKLFGTINNICSHGNITIGLHSFLQSIYSSMSITFVTWHIVGYGGVSEKQRHIKQKHSVNLLVM